MTYKDWLHVYIALIAHQSVRCPNCQKAAIKIKLAGNPRNRMGYGILWCEECKTGIWLSRIEIPEQFDFIPMDKAENEFHWVKTITLLHNT